MDHYIVSARKYRPATFDSVVGQRALTATLKNAIATNRLAHAYLFCGSRGVGKTSCARIFAKTINCQNRTASGDPCNECDSCRAFNDNISLNIIELDAASNNSVDDIRSLTEQVMIPPVGGTYRVFIVDEVHMLSSAAFNAFLKTLEEPPAYAIFILATTEKHKIIPTILSRCQVYDFNRIGHADIVEHLQYVAKQEGVEVEPAALHVIASQADGAMRDALSIFDQITAASHGRVTYDLTIENLNILSSEIYQRLVKAFGESDVPTALLTYKEVRDMGFDSHHFITGLAGYLRDLMVARDPATRPMLDYDPTTVERLVECAKDFEPVFFYQAMNLCNSADMNYRTTTNKTFLVELLLIRLCQLLSPSPNFSGVGEGRLYPIATSASPSATAEPAAAAPAAAPTAPEAPKVAAPQPSRPAAPTPAPAASAPTAPAAPSPKAPASAPPRGSGSGRRVPRLSISKSPQAAPSASAPAAALRPERETPFTIESLMAAWSRYIDEHPTEHIIGGAMRNAMPVADAATPGLYVATVRNELQRDQLLGRLGDITARCRDILGNDHITFAVRVAEGGATPDAWTDHTVYEHMLKSENFKEFAEALGLTLI